MLIFSNVEFSAEQRQQLADRAAPDETYFGDTDKLTADDVSALSEAEIGLGSIPPELLAAATEMRWLQLDSVGCDQYQHLDWTHLATRLTVTNLRDFFSSAVAETGIAGVLALLRSIDRLTEAQATHMWQQSSIRTRSRLLRDSHALIAGYGSIGRALAERLSPFGCTVLTFGTARSGADLVTLAELDQQLPWSDLVFLALPDTPATAGMFNRERLSLMPADTIVVNLGRGALIDEEALIAALSNGRLAGAVLDVTQAEPLPSGHRLWTVPRTVLTQHTAGGWRGELDGKIDAFVANLERYRSGHPLHGIVDWARGY